MRTTTTTPTPTGELRERRERIGLARLALAARAGCSLTTLANIEAGIVPRRSEVLPRILEALDRAEGEATVGLHNDHAPAGGERVEPEGNTDARLSA